MKRSILFLAMLALTLPSCTGVPPVSGTIVTEQGEVTVLPDGRIEIVIEPASSK